MLLLSTAAAATGSYAQQQRLAWAACPALLPQAKFWHPNVPFASSLPRVFCTAHRASADESDDQLAAGNNRREESPWSLDAELDKMLSGEESQTLLKDLKAAAERVAAAKRQLEELDKLEKSQGTGAARVQRLDAADSAVSDCQRDVFAAEAAVKMAEMALVKARAGSGVRDISDKLIIEGIDEDSERVESGKAASVCALVGTITSLPWSLAMIDDTGLELIVSSGLVFVSCALFGVTYRYAVRRDLGNTQLKAGCAAAFALVRGLGQIDAAKLFLGLPEDAMQKLFTVCSIFGESFAIFLFAAVALDYCFRQGYVSPSPFTPE